MESNTFVCKHIVAAIYKCIDDLTNKKNNIKTTQNKLNNNEVSYARAKVTYKFDLDEDNNLRFSFNIGNINRKRYNEIFSAYKENKRLYRLKESIYLDLHNKDIQELLELIDTLGIPIEVDDFKVENSKLYI
ncbi:SNF2 helicase associated domain-containing protein [Paraclostridium bifermentans]|nr:SNF2 helicase associated domain-containing protein [Paraclostridium bifermentans]